ncbi:LacI family DNA-binding transcriptional regulator [Microbacterium lacus]|uniref:LacI family DNA-binding transcriptional regulator n=1 Tax=Microbacterium lacus TaxID=415217 RepID=UPI000C2C9BA1|nr:LacI family DNA-binding transcriptional regulator [Microbacterium lacus]
MAAGRPTIADVARVAQVSPSTASVVFSGKASVTDATRARVLEAAASLGYTGPDPRAASLRRGSSGIVGVVFEEHLGAAFRDPIKAVMMDGLAEGVSPLGAGLLLLRDDAGISPDVDGSGAGAAHPRQSAPSLRSAPVDAVVLVGCSGRLADSLAAVRGRGIPVVVIEGDAGPGIPRVELDNREAQRHAARHLRSLGHENVVLLTLPFDARRWRGWVAPDDSRVPVVDVTRERLAGARDVFPAARVYAAGGSLIDEGLAAGRSILSDAHNRPTAVIAQSDLLAAGVVRAAEELGLSVPADVSVTGFDGITVDGFAPYELTTLVQPAAEKGRAAGTIVTRMIEGLDAASISFTCTFRQGNTTGPPPG